MSLPRGKRHRTRPGNRAMTRRERDYVDRVKRAGCDCCALMGYPTEDDGPVAEGHHHLEGGIRIGHLHVEGLCLWHHKGQIFVEGWSKADHRRELGPNLRDEAGAFRDQFGSDACRLARLHARVKP